MSAEQVDIPARMNELGGEWDPDKQVWIVAPERASDLIELLGEIGASVSLTDPTA